MLKVGGLGQKGMIKSLTVSQRFEDKVLSEKKKKKEKEYKTNNRPPSQDICQILKWYVAAVGNT